MKKDRWLKKYFYKRIEPLVKSFNSLKIKYIFFWICKFVNCFIKDDVNFSHVMPVKSDAPEGRFGSWDIDPPANPPSD